jgi:hypothetical protein
MGLADIAPGADGIGKDIKADHGTGPEGFTADLRLHQTRCKARQLGVAQDHVSRSESPDPNCP